MAHDLYQFAMDVEVIDEEALFRAAVARYLDENPAGKAEEAEAMLRDFGEINVTGCLIMLLDPGSLPGCSIKDSYGELLEAGDDD